MHLEFVSEDVWARFNQTVASVRGWELPCKPGGGTRRP